MQSLLTYIRRGLRYIKNGPEVVLQHPEIKVSVSYTHPNNLLKGKKVLITGGSRGIGFAMAKKFVSEGAIVCITGRNETLLAEKARELGCSYICADLQRNDLLEEIIIRADELLGGINCLVNNAGISLHEGNIMNVTEEKYDAQFQTNLKAAYFLSKYFIELVKSKKTAITYNLLFVSSERGTYVDDLPYGITKNAINCLVRGLSKRVIRDGIRVNAVAPGVTATDLIGYGDNETLYYPANMSKRLYLPDEIAEVASFLLSDVSMCLSGQVLTCDEGRSVNSYFQ